MSVIPLVERPSQFRLGHELYGDSYFHLCPGDVPQHVESIWALSLPGDTLTVPTHPGTVAIISAFGTIWFGYLLFYCVGIVAEPSSSSVARPPLTSLLTNVWRVLLLKTGAARHEAP